jgi:hypothetical protein
MEQIVPPVSGDANHPSAGDVSAYLEGTLSQTVRMQLQAHLAECAECREEMVELSRMLRMQPQQRPVVRWAVGLGIAATLALMVGRLPGGPGTTPSGTPSAPLERGLSTEEDGQISVWSPTAGASLRRDSLVLAWSPAGGSDVRYRTTVSDSSGRVLWTASTPDTILRVPPSLFLPGGRTYYWYTDALLSDGRSLTTGVQEFRMAH